MASGDNVYEFEIDGTTIVCKASMGAAKVYADEFRGKLKKPYTGMLKHDILTAYGAAQETVTIHVEVGEDGKPLRDDDGEYVHKPNGVPVEIPNDDYTGIDAEACMRFMWAMSKAAKGGTRMGWKAFAEWLWDQPIDVDELFAAVMGGPADHYFRSRTRSLRLVEPDDAEGGRDA